MADRVSLEACHRAFRVAPCPARRLSRYHIPWPRCAAHLRSKLKKPVAVLAILTVSAVSSSYKPERAISVRADLLRCAQRCVCLLRFAFDCGSLLNRTCLGGCFSLRPLRTVAQRPPIERT